MREKIWPMVFWAAAVFNFLAGLPSVLTPSMSAINIGLPPLVPEHVMLAQMSGLLICIFGVGYAMVAMGRPGARQIVFLGLLGKIGVCVLLALRLREIDVPAPMIWLTLGDLLFVIAFVTFLVREKRT